MFHFVSDILFMEAIFRLIHNYEVVAIEGFSISMTIINQ